MRIDAHKLSRALTSLPPCLPLTRLLRRRASALLRSLALPSCVVANKSTTVQGLVVALKELGIDFIHSPVQPRSLEAFRVSPFGNIPVLIHVRNILTSAPTRFMRRAATASPCSSLSRSFTTLTSSLSLLAASLRTRLSSRSFLRCRMRRTPRSCFSVLRSSSLPLL